VLTPLLVQRPVLVKTDASAAAPVVVAEGTKAIATYLADTAQPALVGGTQAAERAQVDQWLSFAVADLRAPLHAKNTKVLRDSVRMLNEHLLRRTYMALDGRLSLADVVAWANLHSYMVRSWHVSRTRT
jgi:glutathione S-transferase